MKKILQHIPPPIKCFARIIMHSCIDVYHSITGTRKPMSPPAITSLLVGGGDFQVIGNSIKEDLITTTGLNENSTVLEVGCGYGRVAAALTVLIYSPGRYDGVEIVEKAVE